MQIKQKAALRQQVSCAFTAFHQQVHTGIVLALVSMVLWSLSPATAVAQSTSEFTPRIVRNDRGGVLRTRLAEIRLLRETGRPVRIEGNICYSTCTLYLGLPQTCVSPNTTFGFHGPSSWGRALDTETFNRASRIIADHYPAPLRKWYMDEARYKLRTIVRVDAKQIIQMGVRRC